MVWNDSEHDKCIKNVERLVVLTHKQHQDEDERLSRAGPSSSSSAAAATVNNIPVDALNQIRTAEMNELKLLVEAVKGKDVIGLVTLCTAFFQHKNSLSRQRAMLERLIPQPERVSIFLEKLKHMRPTECPLVKEPNPALDVEVGNDKDTGASSPHSSPRNDDGDCTDLSITMDTIEAGDILGLIDITTKLQQRVRDLTVQLAPPLPSTLLGGKGIVKQALDGEDAADQEAERFQNIIDQVNIRMAENRDHADELKARIAMLRDDAIASTTGLPGHGHQHASGSGPRMKVLADGTIPWQLVRLVPFTANAGDSLSGIAEHFHVDRTHITHASGDCAQVVPDDTSDFTFVRATPLYVQMANPVKGIDEAIASVTKRVKLLEETQIPAAEERVIVAKEAQWEAEVSAMQNPLRQDTRAKEARAIVKQLERERDCFKDTARQCKLHLDAIERADIGGLSFILEGKLIEALDGLGGFERIVYTCKELDPQVSIRDFVAGINVAESELLVFSDKDNNRTFAYIPTVVSRSSVLDIDQKLRKEIQKHKEEHPHHPPRTDLLEQLAALRSGDCAALCGMLSSLRESHAKSSWETELARIRSQVDTLQVELNDAKQAAEQKASLVDGLRQEIQETHEKLIQQQEANATVTLQASEQEKQHADALQKQRVALHSSQEESAAANARADQLLREMNACKQQIALLETKLNEDASRHDELTKRTAELQEERFRRLENDARAATKALEEKTKEHNVAHERLHKEKATLKHELAKAIDDLEAMQRSHQEQLRTEKEKHEVGLEELQHETARLATEVRQGNASISTLKKENAALTQQEMVNTNLIRELEHQVDDAQRNVKGLWQTVEEQATALEEERLKLQKARSEDGDDDPESPINKSKARLQQQLAEAQGKLSQAQQLIDVLETELRELKERSAQMEDLSKRVVFVCKEVPSGQALENFAHDLGVPLDTLLPFFDETNNTKHCYMPTLVPKQSVEDEDLFLRECIATAKVKDPSQKSAVRLSEQHSALRCGDTAALSKMVSEAWGEVEKMQRVIGTLRSAQNAVASGSDADRASPEDGHHHHSGAAPFARGLSFDVTSDPDDDEWWNAQVARKKIALLQEELKKAKKREENWKRLCEEYRDSGKLRDAEIALEEAKADFEHRLRAKEVMLGSITRELEDVRAALETSENKRNAEADKYQLQRKRQLQEREEMLTELRTQLQNERKRHQATLQRISEERQQDAQTIADLEMTVRQLNDAANDNDGGGDDDEEETAEVVEEEEEIEEAESAPPAPTPSSNAPQPTVTHHQ